MPRHSAAVWFAILVGRPKYAKPFRKSARTCLPSVLKSAYWPSGQTLICGMPSTPMASLNSTFTHSTSSVKKYESTERGLLGEALNRAVSLHGGLNIIGRRRFVPADPKDAIWSRLRELVGTLTGVVNGNPNLQWWEGITGRLDWANDRLWLLVEPCTVFDGITDANKIAATDFARERTIRRYNSKLNDLIDFWAHHLSQDQKEMCALNTVHGVDAVFRISPVTCFSNRIAS